MITLKDIELMLFAELRGKCLRAHRCIDCGLYKYCYCDSFMIALDYICRALKTDGGDTI